MQMRHAEKKRGGEGGGRFIWGEGVIIERVTAGWSYKVKRTREMSLPIQNDKRLKKT